MMAHPSTPSSRSPAHALSRAQQLRLLGLAALVLAALAVGLSLVARHGERGEEAAPAPVGRFHPTPTQMKTFTVEVVARHPFATVEIADARLAVNADRSTPVYAPYAGRVASVLAAPGDVVARGAPLALIDASDYADAQSAYAAAASAETLAKANAARKRALLEANGGSEADLQQADADLAAASAARAAARNHLAIFGLDDARIAALGSAPPGAARIALSAPVGGVVIDRQLGPGQYLTAGSGTALYTVADLATVWVIGTLPESSHVRRGAAVDVTLGADPARHLATHLTYVSPTVDPATHRITVRAVLDNPDGTLRPEMLAAMRIEGSDRSEAPGVPAAAVLYEGEHAHVWVVAADGTIALRPVRVGREVDGMVEVLDGLVAGERIVTRGALFIDRAARLE